MNKICWVLVCLSLWACSSSNKKEKIEQVKTLKVEVPEKTTATSNFNGKLSGMWKVVDFKDSLKSIHPDTLAAAKITFLSSFYDFKNDSIYLLRNNRIPNWDDGKWEMKKQEVGYYISFLSNQEKYKDAYQMMFLDENTMQWVKVIPNLGKYAVLLKKQ